MGKACWGHLLQWIDNGWFKKKIKKNTVGLQNSDLDTHLPGYSLLQQEGDSIKKLLKLIPKNYSVSTTHDFCNNVARLWVDNNTVIQNSD